MHGKKTKQAKKGNMYFRIKFKIAIFRLASNGKNKLSTTYTSYFYN